MPHLIIEYSANLEADIDVDALVVTMHETAVDIDVLPVGGIRTRTARRDNVRVADGHPDNGFINVTLRIARGRTEKEQRATGERLFAALKDFVASVFEERPLSLSFEIQEIDPAVRWKHSNIRAFMAARAEGRK